MVVPKPKKCENTIAGHGVLDKFIETLVISTRWIRLVRHSFTQKTIFNKIT